MPVAIPPARRLLLISSSSVYGTGYLDHAEAFIQDFLGLTSKVLFVPYAIFDRDDYAARARERFEAMGYALDSVHAAPDPARAIRDAPALFVGGGNTFRLLKALQDLGLLDAVRARADQGMPYIGASAGSVIAAPTIRTTNDMPIVEPTSLAALGLVPFQLNCHYLDADPKSTHMGETREVRLAQFHEENSAPVAGLREGAMLRIEKGAVWLQGSAAARIFRRGKEPVEVRPEARLDDLLAGAAP